MKGLIYKDITIFFKSIDKKLMLIAVGAIILLMVNTGVCFCNACHDNWYAEYNEFCMR